MTKSQFYSLTTPEYKDLTFLKSEESDEKWLIYAFQPVITLLKFLNSLFGEFGGTV
jgi:hypothetical protein